MTTKNIILVLSTIYFLSEPLLSIFLYVFRSFSSLYFTRSFSCQSKKSFVHVLVRFFEKLHPFWIFLLCLFAAACRCSLLASLRTTGPQEQLDRPRRTPPRLRPLPRLPKATQVSSVTVQKTSIHILCRLLNVFDEAYTRYEYEYAYTLSVAMTRRESEI